MARSTIIKALLLRTEGMWWREERSPKTTIPILSAAPKAVMRMVTHPMMDEDSSHKLIMTCKGASAQGDLKISPRDYAPMKERHGVRFSHATFQLPFSSCESYRSRSPLAVSSIWFRDAFEERYPPGILIHGSVKLLL